MILTGEMKENSFGILSNGLIILEKGIEEKVYKAEEEAEVQESIQAIVSIMNKIETDQDITVPEMSTMLYVNNIIMNTFTSQMSMINSVLVLLKTNAENIKAIVNSEELNNIT